MHLIDRSRIETRLNCRQKRFWQYDFLGQGITPEADAKHTQFGQNLHSALSRLLRSGGNMREVTFWLSGLPVGIEGFWLLSLLVRGWARERLPQVLAEYEVVETEQERRVKLSDDLTLALRRDALLRRKKDGMLLVLDFKTLTSYTESWELILENSLQTVLYTWGTEMLNNQERSLGVQYEGLVRGKLMQDGWSSPLVWIYKNAEGNEFLPTYTARKGWTKVRPWDYMDLEQHERFLMEHGMFEKVFQTVVPRRPLPFVMNEVVQQVTDNETLYHAFLSAPEGEKVRFLEKNLGHCFKYGTKYPCPFYGLCFGGEKVEKMPEGFMVRESHHEEEGAE